MFHLTIFHLGQIYEVSFKYKLTYSRRDGALSTNVYPEILEIIDQDGKSDYPPSLINACWEEIYPYLMERMKGWN